MYFRTQIVNSHYIYQRDAIQEDHKILMNVHYARLHRSANAYY